MCEQSFTKTYPEDSGTNSKSQIYENSRHWGQWMALMLKHTRQIVGK